MICTQPRIQLTDAALIVQRMAIRPDATVIGIGSANALCGWSGSIGSTLQVVGPRHRLCGQLVLCCAPAGSSETQERAHLSSVNARAQAVSQRRNMDFGSYLCDPRIHDWPGPVHSDRLRDRKWFRQRQERAGDAIQGAAEDVQKNL